jgi:orotidine-5'-phosphate decarboxylase
MFVVGATQTEQLAHIRTIIPDHFLLVPGVGAQGGSLQEVSAAGLNNNVGLLVNVSRAVIYADDTDNFAEEAKVVADQYAVEMKQYYADHFTV